MWLFTCIVALGVASSDFLEDEDVMLQMKTPVGTDSDTDLVEDTIAEEDADEDTRNHVKRLAQDMSQVFKGEGVHSRAEHKRQNISEEWCGVAPQNSCRLNCGRAGNVWLRVGGGGGEDKIEGGSVSDCDFRFESCAAVARAIGCDGNMQLDCGWTGTWFVTSTGGVECYDEWVDSSIPLPTIEENAGNEAADWIRDIMENPPEPEPRPSPPPPPTRRSPRPSPTPSTRTRRPSPSPTPSRRSPSPPASRTRTRSSRTRSRRR